VSNIAEKIVDTWGPDSPHLLVFNRMLGELKPDAVDYLPLSQLRDLLGKGISEDLFDRVIFWFSSDVVHLLDPLYEYMEEDSDEGDISLNDVAAALRMGEMQLPSGRIIKDFREHLFVYFRGTDSLECELRRARGDL
jgi:hypothetical protein